MASSVRDRQRITIPAILSRAAMFVRNRYFPDRAPGPISTVANRIARELPAGDPHCAAREIVEPLTTVPIGDRDRPGRLPRAMKSVHRLKPDVRRLGSWCRRVGFDRSLEVLLHLRDFRELGFTVQLGRYLEVRTSLEPVVGHRNKAEGHRT